jgi:hypothetical protein
MKIIINLVLLGFTCCPVEIYAVVNFPGYSNVPTAQEQSNKWFAGRF